LAVAVGSACLPAVGRLPCPLLDRQASLKTLAITLQREYEALSRTNKEKEAGLRQYQRIDQAKRELQVEREAMQKQQESLQRELARIKAPAPCLCVTL
jgi:hypothetical protein